MLDARVDAARRDVADYRLAGRFFAPHYAKPMVRMAGRAVPLRVGPDAAAVALSEVLAGEPFDVLETRAGWVWGISPVDGVVGYAPADAFGPAWIASHVVVTRAAVVRSQASLDSAPLATLPMGTRVAAQGCGDLVCEVDGGFVEADTLRPMEETGASPASIAERLIGAPVLPGGRSGAGVDAEGLVFLALQLSGCEVPRFRDLQMRQMGTDLPAQAAPARDEILFFADHVGIAADAETVVHAGIDAVMRQPLAAVVQRHGPVIARRRA